DELSPHLNQHHDLLQSRRYEAAQQRQIELERGSVAQAAVGLVNQRVRRADDLDSLVDRQVFDAYGTALAGFLNLAFQHLWQLVRHEYAAGVRVPRESKSGEMCDLRAPQ